MPKSTKNNQVTTESKQGGEETTFKNPLMRTPASVHKAGDQKKQEIIFVFNDASDFEKPKKWTKIKYHVFTAVNDQISLVFDKSNKFSDKEYAKIDRLRTQITDAHQRDEANWRQWFESYKEIDSSKKQHSFVGTVLQPDEVIKFLIDCDILNIDSLSNIDIKSKDHAETDNIRREHIVSIFLSIQKDHQRLMKRHQNYNKKLKSDQKTIEWYFQWLWKTPNNTDEKKQE